MTVTPVCVSPGLGWSVNCGSGAGSGGFLSNSALYPASAFGLCHERFDTLQIPLVLSSFGCLQNYLVPRAGTLFFSRITASPTAMGLSLA